MSTQSAPKTDCRFCLSVAVLTIRSTVTAFPVEKTNPAADKSDMIRWLKASSNEIT